MSLRGHPPAGQTIRILGPLRSDHGHCLPDHRHQQLAIANRAVLPDFIAPIARSWKCVPEDAVTGQHSRHRRGRGAHAGESPGGSASVQVFATPLMRPSGRHYARTPGPSSVLTAIRSPDSGTNIDVTQFFLANDSIAVNLPSGATGPVTVTTGRRNERGWHLQRRSWVHCGLVDTWRSSDQCRRRRRTAHRYGWNGNSGARPRHARFAHA